MEKAYTYVEYEDLVKRINEEVKYYDNVFSKDNRYKLYLANGDRICYQFDENKIAHLLGMNLDYLVESSIYKRTSKRSLLDKFLNDSYSIYTKFNGVGFKKIFSDYIENKLDIFREQLKNPYPNSIYFVCKYDRSKNYDTGEVDVYTADYYIARKLQNGDIILLGLVKDENRSTYSVQTSRLIKKDSSQSEELTKFLKGQEITYSDTLEIENYQTMYRKDYHISIEDKKEIIQGIINISKNTNAKPNTIKNHLFDVVGISNSRSKIFNQRLVLSQLIDSIDHKNICETADLNLDMEQINSLDDEIKELIKRWNDLVCNLSFANEGVQNSYSLLEEKNIELEETNKSHEERIRELEEENKLLKEQKATLETYKNAYEDFTSKVFTVVEDEKNKELNKIL